MSTNNNNNNKYIYVVLNFTFLKIVYLYIRVYVFLVCGHFLWTLKKHGLSYTHMGFKGFRAPPTEAYNYTEKAKYKTIKQLFYIYKNTKNA